MSSERFEGMESESSSLASLVESRVLSSAFDEDVCTRYR